MDKRTKNILFITAFGVTLFAILMNFKYVLPFLGNAISLIMPIIVGSIIAIFINVPVTAVENCFKRIFMKKKNQLSDNWYHILGFIVTTILSVVIIFVIFTMIIPAISDSVLSIYILAKERIPEILNYLAIHNINYSWLEEFIAGINADSIISRIGDTAGTLIGGFATAVSLTINVAVTAIFSVIISIYATLDKNRVKNHFKLITTTYLKKSWADKLINFTGAFSKTFAKFLSGQFTEAIILGVLMFSVFAIFRFPYATLVGVFTAFCAIIPYIGAFISCFVCTLIIAIVSPLTAIKALLVYLIVQFVENQFIYPRVVGANVGLPPLYTLIVAMIGGKLFGVVGILFFIPLAATVFTLIKESVNKKSDSGSVSEITDTSTEV